MSSESDPLLCTELSNRIRTTTTKNGNCRPLEGGGKGRERDGNGNRNKTNLNVSDRITGCVDQNDFGPRREDAYDAQMDTLIDSNVCADGDNVDAR